MKKHDFVTLSRNSTMKCVSPISPLPLPFARDHTLVSRIDFVCVCVCVCACIIGDLVSEIKALESRRTQGPLREPMTVPVEAKEHEEECEGASHRHTGAASPSAGGSRDASAAKRGGGGREESEAEGGAWLGAGRSAPSVSELIDKVQGLQDRLTSCRSRVGSLL